MIKPFRQCVLLSVAQRTCQFRVTLVEWEKGSKPVIDMRIFYQRKDTDEWLPSGKGVSAEFASMARLLKRMKKLNFTPEMTFETLEENKQMLKAKEK